MDQETQVKQELAEIHALAKDTHRLARAVRRHQLVDTWGKIIIWVVILGGSAYWFKTYVQPLIAQFRVGNVAPSLFGLPTSTDIQNLINSYKAGQPK
jgi:hypothetical protein